MQSEHFSKTSNVEFFFYHIHNNIHVRPTAKKQELHAYL